MCVAAVSPSDITELDAAKFAQGCFAALGKTVAAFGFTPTPKFDGQIAGVCVASGEAGPELQNPERGGPRERAAKVSPACGQSGKKRLFSGPTRIVLADAHPLARSGLKALLSSERELEICGEAESSAEIPSLLHAARPELLILELSLGDGLGLGAIQRICNEDRNNTRTLVFSMHPERFFAPRALKAGAMGYLDRRASLSAILDAVHAVRSGKRYMSNALLQRLTKHPTEKLSEKSSESLDQRLDRLSDREIEVFTLIGQGLDLSEIGQRLYVSVKTVETHREKIKKRLELKTANEVARYAFRWFMGTH